MNQMEAELAAADAGIQDCADRLQEDFTLLGDWEERYRYVIELGKLLPAGSDDLRRADNKVQGCVSQVWLESRILPHIPPGEEPRLGFAGDSDAHIVRGLIAILLRLYSGRAVGEILGFDASDLFARLGLHEQLSPQRSNGLAAMLRRIHADAKECAADCSRRDG